MTHISLIDASLSTFIEQQAKSSFYYSQTWLDLITKLYGYSPILLTTTNAAGQITGMLPLCSMKSPLTGRRLVSLPFSDHCPLLAVDEAHANTLVDRAIDLARQKHVRYLELRTGINETLAQRPELCPGNLYVRWLLPLNPDPDVVWSGLCKPVQRQIKKSQNLGVRVRIAQHREDMAHYYRLHLQTRSKKQGMPAQPQQFFLGLWDTFATNGEPPPVWWSQGRRNILPPREKGSMAKKEQRVFTQEFKREAVQLAETSGKSMTQIARDLGISDSALHAWRKQFAAHGNQAFPGKGHQTELEEENRQLRRENDILKQEREVVKKAVRIFAQSQL